jgi:hypothetical protein
MIRLSVVHTDVGYTVGASSYHQSSLSLPVCCAGEGRSILILGKNESVVLTTTVFSFLRTALTDLDSSRDT